MVLGELVSRNLLELFNREQGIKKNFQIYCRDYNKKFSVEYAIDSSNPPVFILKIKLKNGNNGEIKNR
jgi:hypothetical protein